ncbi:SCO2525 family SAM-dependent methyltransferase [Frankia sp. Mgl5]|uniref:SCO2525 family SAM-dependent methyltransferase n=1 Tax=Frankia sp. Mgl5 TaxID=2933793 RepID=UPI00200EA4E1|nr:SCO2525 family SAM-dependent methyltransferase [Frankia sp. Mgl5]MCK9929193.1 SCO2525 family SAM-dependent methyltransferase [Frankia sp. Mgl5]
MPHAGEFFQDRARPLMHPGRMVLHQGAGRRGPHPLSAEQPGPIRSDTHQGPPRPEPEKNEDATGNSGPRWDEFDPGIYHAHNYAVLRDDDQQILEGVRDFFATFAAATAADRPWYGLDIGTGSNLYPALSMLPWCGRITLWEHSASNVAWLGEEIRSYSTTWDPFWRVLTQERSYLAVADPRRTLAERAVVERGSVFDLPRYRWDIGTMFFVACSISGRMADFRRASESFLNALVPGAPFAMAYMERSSGYQVGGIAFPAVSVGMHDIIVSLDGMTTDLKSDRFVGTEMLRDGYAGMVLVRGRTRRREPAGPTTSAGA